jgi:hypothetical protein
MARRNNATADAMMFCDPAEKPLAISARDIAGGTDMKAIVAEM